MVANQGLRLAKRVSHEPSWTFECLLPSYILQSDSSAAAAFLGSSTDAGSALELQSCIVWVAVGLGKNPKNTWDGSEMNLHELLHQRSLMRSIVPKLSRLSSIQVQIYEVHEGAPDLQQARLCSIHYRVNSDIHWRSRYSGHGG